jgi:alginate O-acetyltransferase complex protein AlgI
MVFSSAIFLFVFLPLVIGLYFLLHPRLRNLLLLVASLLFYSWGEPPWVMLAAIAINYVGGLCVGHLREHRPESVRLAKWVLAIFLVADVGMLACYKYANFFADNINAMAEAGGGLPVFALGPVRLPLGISFFLFHAISYVVDVYRRKVKAQKNPLDLALYISFFPQLIAGPIVRYVTIADQLKHRTVSLDDFAVGVRRFVIGLGKKLLIANTVAVPADAVFNIPGDQLTAGVAWLGAVCYVLQIYFDFSAYSDMAIGLGRMFGFHFLENFNYPYISRSITELWTRWHISLSTWLRDYLFLPLGGYRVPRPRVYLNLIFVFALCGLWHGAAWNFVLWGTLFGVVQVLERMVDFRKWERRLGPFAHVYVMLIIVVLAVMFRAETLAQTWHFYVAMSGLASATASEFNVRMLLSHELLIVIPAAILGSTPWWRVLAEQFALLGERARQRGGARTLVHDLLFEVFAPAGGLAFMALVLLGSSMKLAAGTHNPFIYFRF